MENAGENTEKVTAATTAYTLGKTSNFERIASYILIGMVFLLPVFFIPSLSVPFQFTKTLIVILATLIIFTLVIISRLKEGAITLPYGSVIFTAWLLPIVYFISAFFTSGSLQHSITGQSFDLDTAAFILIGALLLSLTPLIVKSRERVLAIYGVLLVSFSLLVLYQGVRLLVGPDIMTFEIFTTSTSNLFGKWNDLSIFFGLIAILSMITLEGLVIAKMSKWILYAALAVSIFFLAVINFISVWVVVGLFSLGFVIYNLLKLKFNFKSAVERDIESPANRVNTHTKGLSVAAIITLVISALFVFGGESTNKVASYFNISQLEARPSWQSTADIMKTTYQDSLVFGSGPNTFQKQWALLKPQEINNTIFWSVDFSTGIGMIPTAFVTTGVLGAAAWILFFLALLFAGLRTLVIRHVKTGFEYYITLSSFIASVYLWVFTIIYTPNVVVVTLAFIFTGLFLASLRSDGDTFGYKEKIIKFSENPRIGFVSVLLLTVLLIGTASGFYKVGQRYAAAVSFQQSIVQLNVIGNLETASTKLERAIRLDARDTYHRLGAEINLIELNRIVSDESQSVEDRRTRFQVTLAEAISDAQRATKIGKDNYQNWITLGRVYQSVVSLQIEGAYENAIEAYEEAKRLSPHGASIYFSRAELEVLNGNNEQARVHITEALQQKNNYTNAIFLLSQLQIQAGELTEALRSVEATTLLDPNNPVVFFQLGLLRYNAGDNEGTVVALTKAVALNDVYANARYFLGLAYERLGRNIEAIDQFERIEELNPDNVEVKQILTDLRAGKNLFSEVGTDSPETRETPPIEGE